MLGVYSSWQRGALCIAHPSASLWHDALLPTYTCATLSITLPTQAFLSSAADVNRANEHAFTLLEALDLATVYNVS